MQNATFGSVVLKDTATHFTKRQNIKHHMRCPPKALWGLLKFLGQPVLVWGLLVLGLRRPLQND